MIRFRLNGQTVEVDVDPAERLLDLLRYRLGLTGTKEGCAGGECGACTVYMDDVPVDSCLVPAYQAQGHEITTIEALDPASLDPFLGSGATQCGACTPGVVMTGAWIRDQPQLLDTHTIRELMAGNLCRCTGYDGIVEGVEAALSAPEAGPGSTPDGPGSTPEPRPLSTHETETPTAFAAPRLQSAAPVTRAGVRGSGAVLRPTSVEEALAMLEDTPDAVPIAGATDLLVHWPGHLEAHARTYLDLSPIESLRAYRWTDDELIIGGLTTYWDLIQDEQVRREFPSLEGAARQVGAVQIQTRGTWAGNIANASPAADGVPVLMAYDAMVDLRSSAGTEAVPLDDFYLGYKKMRMVPGQLITGIRLPRRAYDISWFDKVGSRAAQAITKIGVAVTRRATQGDDLWRVVANSAAPTVCRCPSVEGLLQDEPALDSPTFFHHALSEDVAPIDDIRSTRKYRLDVLARLLYFGLRERVAFVS